MSRYGLENVQNPLILPAANDESLLNFPYKTGHFKALSALNTVHFHGAGNHLVYVYVTVNFFLQLNAILPLFLGMVMYDNEFKTKEE